MRTRGSAFRLTGFILGIAGTVVAIAAIVFSLIGLLMGNNAK